MSPFCQACRMLLSLELKSIYIFYFSKLISNPLKYKEFNTLNEDFLTLIFKLFTHSKGQQSLEASKTIDSSNCSARRTKLNSLSSS